MHSVSVNTTHNHNMRKDVPTINLLQPMLNMVDAFNSFFVCAHHAYVYI